MVLPWFRRTTFLLLVSSLLWAGTAYGREDEKEAQTPPSPRQAQTASKDPAAAPDGEKDPAVVSTSGLFPMQDLHKIIRQERLEALAEIDSEREETLAYLSRERQAVVDALTAERRMTMVEMEAMANRIVQNATSESMALIDHLILRILQVALGAILLLALAGYIAYRLVWRGKMQ